MFPGAIAMICNLCVSVGGKLRAVESVRVDVRMKLFGQVQCGSVITLSFSKAMCCHKLERIQPPSHPATGENSRSTAGAGAKPGGTLRKHCARCACACRSNQSLAIPQSKYTTYEKHDQPLVVVIMVYDT